MSAAEGVSAVDFSVARDAERGVVGLARDVGRSLLADLAQPDPRVARCELVGCVDLCVAVDAEESGVRSAEQSRRCRFARVAELRCHSTHYSL